MPILEAETSIYPANLLAEFQNVPPPRNWFIFHTKARQEKALARQLVGMKVPFFLPMVVKDNLIRSRRVQSHIPLFGGYVFILATDAERVQALTTNRVSTVLNVTDQQQLTKDLRQVQQLIKADAPLTVERRLVAGQRVRIKAGPLLGLEGTVEKRRGRSVLYVAVTMLQQSASIEIDDFLLEPTG